MLRTLFLAAGLALGASLAGAQVYYGDQYTSQQDIENNVIAALARSAALRGSNINVASRNDTIFLSGTVRDRGDIDRAERIASRVPGVREVRANLQVVGGRPRTDEEMGFTRVPDDQLARRVATILNSRVFTDGSMYQQWAAGYELGGPNYQVNVEADDGTVVLDGQVPSSQAFRRSIQTARSIPGVRAVDASGLQVEYGYGDSLYRDESDYFPYFGE